MLTILIVVAFVAVAYAIYKHYASASEVALVKAALAKVTEEFEALKAILAATVVAHAAQTVAADVAKVEAKL